MTNWLSDPSRFECLSRCWALLPAVLVAAVLAGCAKPNQYVEPPPPEVTVATPKQDTVIEYVEVTGVAHPVKSVEIRARVKGFLRERLFEEGALVEEGQLLLVIDEEPFQVKLAQAQARLGEAEALLTKAKQSRAREVARAQLALDESQLRLAQDEEKRVRKLAVTRAMTEEDLERALANLKKNEAQVNATKATLRQVDADYTTTIQSAEASLAATKTAVREAEIELSYCRITSPISGRIGRVLFDVGNLVGDGQATLLTNVVTTAPVYAYTSVSLEDFLKYRSSLANKSGGEPVLIEVGLANEVGYPHRGRIDYHDPQVDRGTGTIQIRGVFENTAGLILPGMFVRIRIPFHEQLNALLVPERALGVDQVGDYLLVVGKDDTVEYRPVEAGPVSEGMRMVTGKIAATDRVVVEGLLRARPGMKVVPKAETSSSSATPIARSITTQASKESHN
jgi:membrane fusion protein (multidrug efflux system)